MSLYHSHRRRRSSHRRPIIIIIIINIARAADAKGFARACLYMVRFVVEVVEKPAVVYRGRYII